MAGIILIYKKTFLESQKDLRVFDKVKINSPEIWQEIHASHEAHQKSVELFCRVLDKLAIPYAAYGRSEEAGNLERADLVITLGGDGTFIHASHYLKETPLLGFNSAVGFSVGHYCISCPVVEKDLEEILEKVFSGSYKRKSYLRLQIYLNGEPVEIPVLNDILISENLPAATSRYLLCYENFRQLQKSSGIWIATPSGVGAGYTSAGGLPFSEEYLCAFVVRELYGKNNQSLLSGFLSTQNLHKFAVISSMSQGRVFIDGSHSILPFSLGDKLEIKIYPYPLLSFDTGKEL